MFVARDCCCPLSCYLIMHVLYSSVTVRECIHVYSVGSTLLLPS